MENDGEITYMKNVAVLIAHLGGGGAERVTAALSNQFVKDGYNVSLIVFDTKYNEYYISEGVKKYFLPQGEKRKLLTIKKIIALRKILKKIKPDYVISLGFSYKYLFFGNLLKKYNFILSERNDPTQLYSKAYLKIVNYCLERSEKVVFQTEWAKSLFPDSIQIKSAVVPNPINESILSPYFGKRKKKVVAYSRLTKQKNIPMLLNAFKIMLNTHPEYILEIYGRGECEKDMKEYAANIGIADKVFFMGFQKNVHEQIKDAAMYVSSSDFEGISNSMLEAMAIGLPSICTDCPVGGARMFINSGKNGWLVPVGAVDRLAETMIYVADNEQIAENVGREATKIKQELSIDLIAKQWERMML